MEGGRGTGRENGRRVNIYIRSAGDKRNGKTPVQKVGEHKKTEQAKRRLLRVVEIRGLEPLTSALRTQRSTN